VHYKRFDIKNEDTLERPQHVDQRFEAIVANPPFSANWSARPWDLRADRFSNYGKLAPSSKEDFAFVQHMVHQLADNGTMAVVLPHGVLFRGAAEGHIRKYLIQDRNYLDAVIGLPANIFYGTSIPTCILVLKKNRPLSGAEGKILFIDASQHFEKVKTQNYLREEDINKLIDTYKTFSSPLERGPRGVSGVLEEKYSYIANLKEVAENDYTLNIPRYVDTFEEEEPVDLATVSKDLKSIDKDLKSTDATIKKFCDELGIDTPF
jgi:type I restriction enzyme M protein